MSVRKFFLLGGSVAGNIGRSSTSSSSSVFRSLCSSAREDRSPVDFASIALQKWKLREFTCDLVSQLRNYQQHCNALTVTMCHVGEFTVIISQNHHNYHHVHTFDIVDTWKQLSLVFFWSRLQKEKHFVSDVKNEDWNLLACEHDHDHHDEGGWL